ncbi:MAG: 30S ribosomal protein S6 [Gaiellaceae bacterium]
MNDYELLIMLDPDLAEERQTDVLTRARAVVEGGGGSWSSHQPWGRRRLAYEIRHKSEGVYHLISFSASAATLAELSRVLRIDDAVMRHMPVRRTRGSSAAQAAPPAPAPAAVAAEPESVQQSE